MSVGQVASFTLFDLYITAIVSHVQTRRRRHVYLNPTTDVSINSWSWGAAQWLLSAPKVKSRSTPATVADEASSLVVVQVRFGEEAWRAATNRGGAH